MIYDLIAAAHYTQTVSSRLVKSLEHMLPSMMDIYLLELYVANEHKRQTDHNCLTPLARVQQITSTH